MFPPMVIFKGTTTRTYLRSGIENANSILNSNTCIITKSFLVTGLSNALVGHEDHLIRDDAVRIEIDKKKPTRMQILFFRATAIVILSYFHQSLN